MVYGYQYFSGANTVVELDGVAALECAGISYSINESKRPIYGYSSRFFDAVARGQVLVQGSFVVNYVHEDYVREALSATPRRGAVVENTPPDTTNTSEIKASQVKDEFGRPLENQALLKQIAQNWSVEQTVANGLRDLYWPQTAINRQAYNPHDPFGGFDIRITFGERKPETGTGITGFLLQGVYIVGRGKQIQISEDVIVEELPFFARNSVPIYPEYEIVEDGDVSKVRTPSNIM